MTELLGMPDRTNAPLPRHQFRIHIRFVALELKGAEIIGQKVVHFNRHADPELVEHDEARAQSRYACIGIKSIADYETVTRKVLLEIFTLLQVSDTALGADKMKRTPCDIRLSKMTCGPKKIWEEVLICFRGADPA